MATNLLGGRRYVATWSFISLFKVTQAGHRRRISVVTSLREGKVSHEGCTRRSWHILDTPALLGRRVSIATSTPSPQSCFLSDVVPPESAPQKAASTPSSPETFPLRLLRPKRERSEAPSVVSRYSRHREHHQTDLPCSREMPYTLVSLAKSVRCVATALLSIARGKSIHIYFVIFSPEYVASRAHAKGVRCIAIALLAGN
ncbi:hypothetical protein DFP72DRAFT_207239 [Ephemerocybe angulata]|uniref:Uncharacterized protein n=1 Tax=Ephemerocybe angulata TaxID=980116 RepID=A0A8H6MHP0_9AGAR|nr:hypothetical protein DFP72DRAFT_207239 [Tulosesus angulatus]